MNIEKQEKDELFEQYYKQNIIEEKNKYNNHLKRLKYLKKQIQQQQNIAAEQQQPSQASPSLSSNTTQPSPTTNETSSSTSPATENNEQSPNQPQQKDQNISSSTNETQLIPQNREPTEVEQKKLSEGDFFNETDFKSIKQENETVNTDMLQIINQTTEDPTYSLKDLKDRQQMKYITTDDNNLRCIPNCQNKGICEMGQCYCPFPFSGKKCENHTKVDKRISTLSTIIFTLFCFVLGILTVYAVKKINDCINLIVGESDEQQESVEIFNKKN